MPTVISILQTTIPSQHVVGVEAEPGSWLSLHSYMTPYYLLHERTSCLLLPRNGNEGKKENQDGKMGEYTS